MYWDTVRFSSVVEVGHGADGPRWWRLGRGWDGDLHAAHPGLLGGGGVDVGAGLAGADRDALAFQEEPRVLAPCGPPVAVQAQCHLIDEVGVAQDEVGGP